MDMSSSTSLEQREISFSCCMKLVLFALQICLAFFLISDLVRVEAKLYETLGLPITGIASSKADVEMWPVTCGGVVCRVVACGSVACGGVACGGVDCEGVVCRVVACGSVACGGVDCEGVAWEGVACGGLAWTIFLTI